MNLIEELKNYCDINNPVGALMLSGEWGCGKTYLIKTKFIPSVKDTCNTYMSAPFKVITFVLGLILVVSILRIIVCNETK